MNLSDLRIFLAVARGRSVVAAAAELHLTPSAVSKALRRLEDDLGCALFDRTTRQLVLNAGGDRLVERAQLLLALAEGARADVRGDAAPVDCRIGGPAVLLWDAGPRIARALAAHTGATLRLEALFEDAALGALARGEIGAAVVTGAVTDGRGPVWSADWDTAPLGALVLHLVAGRTHPLVAAHGTGADGACHVPVAQVLVHDFVCPTRSLFCGEGRGGRSDGWRDDALPRRIRYWTDDLHLLSTFVRGGAALAYLPQAALADGEVVPIHLDDCPFTCGETSWLVWDRRTAPGWLVRLAAALAADAAPMPRRDVT